MSYRPYSRVFPPGLFVHDSTSPKDFAKDPRWPQLYFFTTVESRDHVYLTCADRMPNHTVSTIFASIGCACWSIQIIPQIYLNHRRKSTDGFSGLMMTLWVSAGVPLGIYNVTRDLNIGLIIQPQCFMFFALICTVQTYHYRLNWSIQKSVGIVLGFMALLAGLEAAGIELLYLGIRNGVHWPVTMVGILSAVLINIGLVPQFYEIWKRNAVIGVSFLFLSIDCAGAVFSFMSLPFDEWDIVAAISYGLLIVEEFLLFALGIGFWLRDRKHGKTVDEEASEVTRVAKEDESGTSQIPGITKLEQQFGSAQKDGSE